MKKIFLLVAFFVFGKICLYAQYPLTQQLGSDSTIVISKGALQSRLINVTYTDTAAANLQRIRQYPGAQIATTSGGINLWVRNANATAWLPINTGSGNNIYTINGTLTGNRTLTGGGYPLTFTGLDKFVVSADSIRFTTGDLKFGLNTDSASLTKKISYSGNYRGDYKQFTLVDKGYVDSVVASSPAGTVTQVNTNNATGITGGPITSSGTLAIDTLLVSTRAWRQKGIDSVAALANSKVGGSLISGYITKATGTNTIDTSQLFQNGQNVGIGTLTPNGRLAIVDTGGFALRINYNSASNVSDSNAAIYAENNGLSSYVAILNEKTTNNTGAQLPLLVESSLTTGTPQVNMGTGMDFGTRDDANNRKLNRLIFRNTNAAAANYSSRAELRLWNNGAQTSPYFLLGNGNVGLGTSTPDSNLTVVNGALFGRGIRASGLPQAPGTKALRIDASGNISYADTLIDAGGTVTSVATNNGTGITGGTITTSGTLAIDTTLISTRAWRQKGIDSVANLPRVTSVGLTMPVAFNVAGSPVTSSGTLAVTGAGLASQYIRGDGTLANFPGGGGGGGASVSYYLNGSVNQGTFGGNTYYQMNKTPVLGAGTNFTINANGYIAQFITNAGDPALLNIPAGNWNFELFFSASSGGGTPSYYVELYKYDGTIFTLIASNSSNPDVIVNSAVDAYFSALPVPQTTLTLTDRLAVRIYVTHAGRTITLHTEDNNLCQVITTFTTGITALNSLTAQVQYLTTGTSGTDFNISSLTDTHTFNLPVASATNTGKLSSANWSTFNSKIGPSDTASMLLPYLRKADTTAMLANYVNNVGYGLLKSGQVVRADSATLANYFLRRKDSLTSTNLLGYVTRKILADTAAAIRSADAGGTVTSVATNTGTGITGGTITSSGTLAIDTLLISTRAWRQKGIDSLQANINLKLNISDTASMLSPYLRSNTAAATYVPQTRTITINGTSQDLSANRTYNVGTVTSVATNTGTGITGGTFTTSGTIAADTLLLSTRAWRQKGIDSVAALINNNISGTTNFIPRFSSANVIGNSIMRQSGTSIGINTSPSYTLDILETGSANIGAGTANNKIVITGNDNGGSIATTNTTYINFAPFQVEAMRITSSGVVNMGANFANNFNKLNVGGSATIGYSTNVLGPTDGLSINGSLGVGLNGANTDSALSVLNGVRFQRGVRMSGLPSAVGTKTLRIDASGTVSVADTGSFVPTSRTLTINGTTQDLSADRTWNVGTVTTAAATGGGQVAFFNGSTVLTSISTLYFDGVNKLAIGNSSPDSMLSVTQGAHIQRGVRLSGLPTAPGTRALRINANGTLSVSDTLTNGISGSGTTNYIPKFTSSSAIGNSAIYDNGTNVIVGGTSGLFKFQVNDASLATIGLNSSGEALDQKNWVFQYGTSVGAGTFRLRAINDAGTDGQNAYIITRSGTAVQTHQWLTAGSERMRLDASGNLGLGVTPSAGLATANYRLFQIGLDGAGSIYSGSNQTLIGTNINWVGGTPNYAITGYAPTLYNQQNGAHSWNTAPSGTAGNAISFTQAMTLDASGRLGIGTTVPASLLSVGGAGYSGRALTVTGSTAATYAATIQQSNATGLGLQIYTTNTSWGGDPINISDGAGNTQLRMNSSGNVGIGTTSPGTRLEASVSRTNGTNVNVFTLSDNLTGVSTAGFGTRIQGISNGGGVVSAIGFENGGTGTNNESQLSFYTQNTAGALTRQMMISSTGNVGIGTTSPDSKLQVTGTIKTSDATNDASIVLTGLDGAYGLIQANNNAGTLTKNLVLQKYGGNVGIGTSSPQNQLQVTGGSNSTILKISSTDQESGTLALGDGSSSGAYIGLWRGAAASLSNGNYLNLGGYGGIVFTSSAAAIGSQTERMRITSGGVLRLLNSTPTFDFTLASNTAFSHSIVASNYSSSPISSNTLEFRVASGASTQATVMTLNGAGNVGIGITDDNPIGNGGTYRNLLVGNGAGYGVFQGVSTATASGSAIVAFGGGTTGASGSKNAGSINLELDGTSTTNATGRWVFYTGSGGSTTERMRITSGGEVYIGNNPADQGAYNLQVNGTGVWGAGAYVNGSDSALKYNIQPLEPSLDIVKQMKPVTFEYQPFYSKDTTTQTGFIAQDLQRLLADKVYKNGIVKEGGAYLGVAYENIIPLLVKAIQELEAKVENLKTQLNNR